MKTLPALCLLAPCLLICARVPAQELAAPTELPGDPYFIKKTWQVPARQDTLAAVSVDTRQSQLFLSSQSGVEAHDLQSGARVNIVSGLQGFSGIALDATGEFGYVADPKQKMIDAFDRRTLRIVGKIPTAATPSAVLYEPSSNMIFAFGSNRAEEKPASNPAPIRPSKRPKGASTPAFPRPISPKPATIAEDIWILTVIDADTWSALADIKLEGKPGFIQTAGNGHVYFGLPKMRGIIRVEADALAEKLRKAAPAHRDSAGRSFKEQQLQVGLTLEGMRSQRATATALDWSAQGLQDAATAGDIVLLHTNSKCADSRSAAVDEHHLRLFLTCSDQHLDVLNADNGDSIATLPTGPDTRAIAYDFDRRTIYAANAEGHGSLTIIHQHATDSYAVVQNLPTPRLARALAVDPSTGLVYLVTDYSDFDDKELSQRPVQGNFVVAVIGH